MNGLLSAHPSPTAIRLAVGALMLGQVQAIILLWAPGIIVGPPRALVVVLTFLSFGSLVGESSTPPEER